MKIEMEHWKRIFLGMATALIVGGCNVYVPPPSGEVEVSGAPPAPQIDVETPQPGPGYVWIRGAWVWGPGDHWVWDRGYWDRPPHPGAVWVGPRYEYRHGHRVYLRGRWR